VSCPQGLTLNEVFNQGVPVIVTYAVGAPAGGLVQNVVNGFVIRERDALSMANALNWLLEDEGLRMKLITNAYQTILLCNNERTVSGFRQAIKLVTNE